jgi:hypothetical protein
VEAPCARPPQSPAPPGKKALTGAERDVEIQARAVEVHGLTAAQYYANGCVPSRSNSTSIVRGCCHMLGSLLEIARAHIWDIFWVIGGMLVGAAAPIIYGRRKSRGLRNLPTWRDR